MALNIPFDADLAMAEADLPQTVTLAGITYSACVNDPTHGQDLEMQGIAGESDLSVTIRVSVLAAVTIGTRLVYNSRNYRVDRVNYSPCGAAYRLECVDISR